MKCPHCWPPISVSPNNEFFNCNHCNQPVELKENSLKKSSKFWWMSGLIIILIIGYGTFSFFKNIFKSENQENLEIIASAVDIENPKTMDFASQIAKYYPGNFNYGQACLIHAFLVSKWKYVEDPRSFNHVRKASQTISNNFTGDCDDFAILISAMIESVGGKTRLSYAYGEDSGHTFAELYCGKTEEDLVNAIKSIWSIYKRRFNIH